VVPCIIPIRILNANGISIDLAVLAVLTTDRPRYLVDRPHTMRRNNTVFLYCLWSPEVPWRSVMYRLSQSK